MNDQKLTVQAPIFDQLDKLVSCQTIAEKGTFKKAKVLGKDLCITGSLGSGSGGRSSVLFSIAVVRLPKYRGELEPLEYFPHNNEIRLKRRERSYNGMKIKLNNQFYVMTGPEICIFPTDKGSQLELF